MTITEFLLARIAEDEAEARATPKRERFRVAAVDEATANAITAHAARWEPVRVLAECEAKRRIIEAFEDERVRRDIYNRDYDSGEYDFNESDLRARRASNALCRGLEIALLALAAVYADHPDFDPAWRAE